MNEEFKLQPVVELCTPDEHGHCITCSDEAIPARVIEVETDLAWVELKGQRTAVDTSLVEHVAVGQMLLVHGGVALAQLSSEEAAG